MSRSLRVSIVVLIIGAVSLALSGWWLFSSHQAHAASWPEHRRKLTAQTGQYSMALEEQILRAKYLQPYRKLMTDQQSLNASQIALLDLLRQIEAQVLPLSQQFSITASAEGANLTADLPSIEISRLVLQLRFLHERQFYEYLDQLRRQTVALLEITDLEMATVAATESTDSHGREQALKVSLGLHWYGQLAARGPE